MRTAAIRTAAVVGLAAALPLGAQGAMKAFAGPAGWDHTVQTTATASLPRSQETWKKSDGESLVLLADDGLAYDDVLAMVVKSAASLHASVNRDLTCAGRKAHEVEETFGPTVVHQMIVDDSPGVTKLTYTRPQKTPMSPDVTAAFTAYCGSP
jgi:hypothetical protein